MVTSAPSKTLGVRYHSQSSSRRANNFLFLIFFFNSCDEFRRKGGFYRNLYLN